MPEPSPIDLVHQIREALGWPVVALPVTPQKAFEDCLWQIRFLREENDLLRGAVPGSLSKQVDRELHNDGSASSDDPHTTTP
jgi:hypothetical protein